MATTALNKLTQASQRLRAVLAGVLIITLILAGMVYWSIERLLGEESDKLTLHFSHVIEYIQEQEIFLQQLHIQNSLLQISDLHENIEISSTPSLQRPNLTIFTGQELAISMPFTLICDTHVDCPASSKIIFSIGDYLSDHYRSFWATSRYPQTQVFLLNSADTMSLGVPAINAVSGYEEISESLYMAALDLIRQHIQNIVLKNGLADYENVQWVRASDLPGDARYKMFGLISADIPAGLLPPGKLQAKPSIFAASMFSLDRISIREESLNRPIYDELWLLHKKAGLLLGSTPPPTTRQEGISYNRNGLIFKISDMSGTWTALYRVSYASFFQHNIWLPIIIMGILLLGVCAEIYGLRLYRRRMVAPVLAAHLALQESEAFSRAIIETSPVALAVIRLHDGDTLFSNQLAHRWLGLSVGQNAYGSASIGPLIRKLREKAAAPSAAAEELYTVNGLPLYVMYSQVRHRGQDVLLCAFSDISPYKQAEQTLSQAKQAADMANEAKSTFLATMSHEIRTPLYSILGTLEILELTELNQKQKQHVRTIQNASAVLLQLISDILDISRIESVQLTLANTDFNPLQLIDEAISSYSPMAAQKKLLLYACVDASMPEMITGDAIRIHQILNNLLSNAIKFTDWGHVAVRVKKQNGDAGPMLLLQVADTGIGIGQEAQTHLFTPFYQIAAHTHTHTLCGTGLGLSICARLVELMGGTIRLVSEPGLGSSFSVLLPLVPSSARTSKPAPNLSGVRVYVRSPVKDLSESISNWLNRWQATAQPAPARLSDILPDSLLLDVLMPVQKAPEGWRGDYLAASAIGSALDAAQPLVNAHSVYSIGYGIAGLLNLQKIGPTPQNEPFQALSLRVLVAEDNPINLTLLKQQLEQLGCTVTAVSDGASALAQWQPGRFDIVLTDVNMPHMNGYELTQALRKQGCDLPIIGVTANAMADEEKRCIAAGMDAWLVKPLRLHTLRRYLSAGQAASPILASPSEADDSEPVFNSILMASAKFRTLFIKTMSDDIHALAAALAQTQAQIVLSGLHRIRGALAVVKVHALEQNCLKMEDHIRSNGMNAENSAMVQDFINEIRNQLDKLAASS